VTQLGHPAQKQIPISLPSTTLTLWPQARLLFKGASEYNTAAAGTQQLALSAGNELMWNGIQVNLIEPGWIDMSLSGPGTPKRSCPAGGKRFPFDRLVTAEDIGRAAGFLVSDAAAGWQQIRDKPGEATRRKAVGSRRINFLAIGQRRCYARAVSAPFAEPPQRTT
jgi:NAD(P)-dependent dehydrogenase (short-subunit alcohol dehydrogenase family)